MHGNKCLFTFCNPADQTQYDACNGNIFIYLNKFKVIDKFQYVYIYREHNIFVMYVMFHIYILSLSG